MVHNPLFRVLALLALFAVLPVGVAAAPPPAPLPPLPPVPNPAPNPNPAPPQNPPPQSPGSGNGDLSYAAPESANPSAQKPYGFSGPTGRVLLDGTWGYRADPGDQGVARGWQRGNFSSRHVHIPYVANAWPVTGTRGLRNFEGSVGWFVKHFRVAKAGRYAIRFESVHHRARVWI